MTEEIKEETLSFDIKEIMDMIPHRYPFLLVYDSAQISVPAGRQNYGMCSEQIFKRIQKPDNE